MFKPCLQFHHYFRVQNHRSSWYCRCHARMQSW